MRKRRISKTWEKYFLIQYNQKTDYPIGVYENIDEAILEVYGYDLNHPKFRTAKNSIISSYSGVLYKGRKRTAHGSWYKIER